MNARTMVAGCLIGAALGAAHAADAGRAAAAPQTQASFTSAQAYQGRFAYIANCAECHGGDLSGQFGPALAGPHSNVPWQTPKAVYDYIVEQMPVGNAGGLSRKDYLAIEAFILQSNGRRAGSRPLTLDAVDNDPFNLDGSRS